MVALALAAIHPVHHSEIVQASLVLHISGKKKDEGLAEFRGRRWTKTTRGGILHYAWMADQRFDAEEPEWIRRYDEANEFATRCIEPFEEQAGCTAYGPFNNDGGPRLFADESYDIGEQSVSSIFKLTPSSKDHKVNVYMRAFRLNEEEFKIWADAMVKIIQLRKETT